MFRRPRRRVARGICVCCKRRARKKMIHGCRVCPVCYNQAGRLLKKLQVKLDGV